MEDDLDTDAVQHGPADLPAARVSFTVLFAATDAQIAALDLETGPSEHLPASRFRGLGLVNIAELQAILLGQRDSRNTSPTTEDMFPQRSGVPCLHRFTDEFVTRIAALTEPQRRHAAIEWMELGTFLCKPASEQQWIQHCEDLFHFFRESRQQGLSIYWWKCMIPVDEYKKHMG